MENDNFLRNTIILFVSVGLFIGIIVTLGYYKTSCYSAKIYNQQHKTNYTCADFFWASEQINSNTQTIKITK